MTTEAQPSTQQASARRRFSVRRPGNGAKRGQGIVEFSFALPFLLLILLGTIDMGQLFFEYIQLRGGVREAAAYGARNPGDTGGTLDALYRHSDVLGDGGTAASVQWYGVIEVYSEATVVVSATREFQPLTTSFLQRFGLGPVTLNARATARVWT